MAGPTDPLEHGSVDPLGSLTDRQREVLDMVLEHKTSKEIARELGIGPKTVDRHIDAAREKLGVADRNAAARLYARLRERGEKPQRAPSRPSTSLLKVGGTPLGPSPPYLPNPLSTIPCRRRTLVALSRSCSRQARISQAHQVRIRPSFSRGCFTGRTDS